MKNFRFMYGTNTSLRGGNSLPTKQSSLFSGLPRPDRLAMTDKNLTSCGFADGRSETSPDSEQIEHTATKLHMRNSVSVEQIQDNRPNVLSTSTKDKVFSPFTSHFSQKPSLSCGHLSRRERKCAFTLAEVLITLGIIGVVAAITMPTLITNVTERSNSARHANIANKVTQAMDQMRANGLLTMQYASTDAFVDELQKYLKIAKRCDADHITECWPVETVTDTSGEAFEVSTAKTGINLNHKENTTNNVGLILADGASIILTYNQNASSIDVGDPVTAIKMDLPVGGGKSKEFAYSTSVTAPIDFVMDVNGGKGPNSETVDGKFHDIRSFNGAKFGKGCAGFMIGDMCIVNKGTSYDCISEAPYTANDNCWAGAKKACSDMGMHLASRGELSTIYSHKGEPNVPTSGWFWSSAENSTNYAWCKPFDNGYESYGHKYGHYGALCVGN